MIHLRQLWNSRRAKMRSPRLFVHCQEYYAKYSDISLIWYKDVCVSAETAYLLKLLQYLFVFSVASSGPFNY